MAGTPVRHQLRLAAGRRSVSLALTLAGLTVGAVGLLAQAPSGASGRVVEAERFIVRDPAGRSRIELTVLGDGSPTLGLLDRDGVPRAVLGLAPDGTPALALLGRDERARVTLSLRAGGKAGLEIRDVDGRARAQLEVASDGQPELNFLDQAGSPRAAMGVMGDGRIFVFPGGR
jgi:hypothetical protein